MAGISVDKKDNFKDNDWLILHREPGGLGTPHFEDGVEKRYGMKVRDFLSDIPLDPVTDTDCPSSGVENTLMRPVMYDAGSPPALDVDRVVTVTDMIVGAYVIDEATPLGGGAMNVTITTAVADGIDTMGTVLITGTDLDDQVLTDTIIPATDATVQGTRAFKTVVSAVGAGWSTNGGADQITIGFGDLIGLPDLCVNNTVLFAVFNAVREVAVAVTFSTTVLGLNTVDLTSATDGSAVQIYYLV